MTGQAMLMSSAVNVLRARGPGAAEVERALKILTEQSPGHEAWGAMGRMLHLGVVFWIIFGLGVFALLLSWFIYRYYRSLMFWGVPAYETVLLTAVVSPFVMAFASRLGERLGTAVRIERLPRRLRWRRRRELVVAPARARGRSITLEVRADMGNEARLALIELDVAQPELWGHRLRWDDGAQAWLPVPGRPDDQG
ncbi:hypothetical protein AB0M32_09625 [Streptomyces sp. NPDC051985]|uniref:hypothetical protein n=1 Tax=Streptomyces sp. NPDC051985 TaxID=3155807 RepID=UPI00342844B6